MEEERRQNLSRAMTSNNECMRLTTGEIIEAKTLEAKSSSIDFTYCTS